MKNTEKELLYTKEFSVKKPEKKFPIKKLLIAIAIILAIATVCLVLVYVSSFTKDVLDIKSVKKK